MGKKFTIIVALLLLIFSDLNAAEKVEIFVQPSVKDYPEIKLNINARDKSGKPVPGLTMKDFTILEDLGSVKIDSFKELELKEDINRVVDIVFVFDDTGSMSNEIRGLRDKVIEFANIIKKSNFDFRLGLITYKDKIYKPFRMTDNAGQFQTWVSRLKARGGGDEPENALDAIDDAAKQTYRKDAKVIFILITDATFHAANKITSLTMHSVVSDLKEKNIQFHAVGPNMDQYKVMTAELNGTFYDKDSGQFKRIIAQIAGGSASNYTISYKSNRPEHDFTWRAIDVSLNGKTVVNGVGQYQAPGWVTASSRKNGLMGDRSPYSPQNVIDGNKSTNWIEGVDGSGISEWISLNFDETVKADKFVIKAPAGYAKLPKRISVVVNDEEKRFYNLTGTSFTGDFGHEVEINTFKIIIENASGSSIGISEVELFGGKPSMLVKPIQKTRVAKIAAKIAKDFNKKGEKLYHKKKYEEAIYYYKEAITKNLTYAQAYSNLGLAYQRIKDYPKAVWANRKAISLAKGKTKAIVSASSYYNIARIFESQHKYEQALQNFYWAKSLRSHKAYDKGIRRMKGKLGI
ncbi:MAG: VWA domain-containing protein [Desulfobacterales bacterium]|nr:VWA domain-containing protein [Desulfobacterales bacterium]MCP4162788.1 VWA domain-containing protein [Deltaproteobacteria bacterium]